MPGAPFSADQVTIRTRVGADGKSVETRESRRIFRDSSGRTREDITPGLADTPKMEPLALIRDPVAGVVYALEAPTQTAHRLVIPKPPNGGPVMSSYGMPFPANSGKPDETPKGRGDVKSESLGTQTIQGIEAQGGRTTVTWSAESQGTERDVVSVNEMWISRELGMLLLQKRSDASSGIAVMQLENIRRDEPDASLFVAPPDYQIVDLH
jgi:hypothetical protein